MPVVWVVDLHEFIKVFSAQPALLEREVVVGAQVIEPDLGGPGWEMALLLPWPWESSL
jgi:hypothetical protein